jgi:hypothetical protein
MPTLHALPRTLAAMLAVAAIIAPTAVAQVTAPPSPPTPSERQQDLRHLKAGKLTFTSETAPRDLGPVYAAPDPAAMTHTSPAASDDSSPWMTIGLAIAVACFLVAAAAATVTRLHLRTRDRVAV